MQLSEEVQRLLSRLGETPENFTGRILFMSMFNDIYCGTRDNEQECLANAQVVSIFAKKFGTGQWSFIGPGSEKKWYSMKEDSPQGIWDNLAEKMLIEFTESGCPIFRFTTVPFRKRLRLFLRIVVSANQLSFYGAIAEMCEEYETLHDRTRQPVVGGQ